MVEARLYQRVSKMTLRCSVPAFAILLSLLYLLRCGPAEAPPAEGREIIPLRPPPREYWPTESWRLAKTQSTASAVASATASQSKAALNLEALANLESYLFTLVGTEEERRGVRTNALLIVKDGYLVYEKYGRGYGRESLHPTWSISKSFVNALVGIAQRQRIIDIDKSAARYYAALNSLEKREITVRHLLNMSSGIAWTEGYEYSPLKSSVIAMLYTRGRSDMAAFTAAQAMRSQPGSYLYYSSGDTNLLMAVLASAVQKSGQLIEQPLEQPAEQFEYFVWESLFRPIGMRRVVWERDGAGNFVASSYLYTTARDLARFGYLYLNNGRWEERIILEEDWINFTRTPAPAYLLTPKYEGLESRNIGAHWHLNTGVAAAGISQPWPAAPADTFAALGHWGQSLWILPSLDAVVVRFADDRDASFDQNRFLELVVASMKSEGQQ